MKICNCFFKQIFCLTYPKISVHAPACGILVVTFNKLIYVRNAAPTWGRCTTHKSLRNVDVITTEPDSFISSVASSRQRINYKGCILACFLRVPRGLSCNSFVIHVRYVPSIWFSLTFLSLDSRVSLGVRVTGVPYPSYPVTLLYVTPDCPVVRASLVFHILALRSTYIY